MYDRYQSILIKNVVTEYTELIRTLLLSIIEVVFTEITKII